MFSVAGNRLIVAGRFHKSVYSEDLKESYDIPFRVLSGMFPRSGVVGDYEQGAWKTFRVSSPPALMQEGSGDILSVSDDAIVFRDANEVRLETPGGRLVGSIPVSADTKGAQVMEVAGKNRVYWFPSGEERIEDYSGKEISKIHPPAGWGFRHGWSSDGKRMLFDHFTRTVPAWQAILDGAANGLGLGVPEESNGETVRVIDPTTGAVCFNLESPGRLVGQPGNNHADLSPSGRMVVVSTLGELSVYRLPEVRGGN